MKCTGERYVPIEEGKVRLEFSDRHAVISDLLLAKDVREGAYVEGYGS